MYGILVHTYMVVYLYMNILAGSKCRTQVEKTYIQVKTIGFCSKKREKNTFKSKAQPHVFPDFCMKPEPQFMISINHFSG